jgi:hypothetical protein
MFRIIVLVLLSIPLYLSMAHGAVLVWTSTGQLVAKSSLAVATSSADTLGRVIIVTSPITVTTSLDFTGRTLRVEGKGWRRLGQSGSE